jgi:hypothetical protein
VDHSASLRVDASHWSVSERTAEGDAAKGIRVHIGVCVRFSAGAVKGATGELAVADVAVVGLDSGLARRSVGPNGLVAVTFGILDFQCN